MKLFTKKLNPIKRAALLLVLLFLQIAVWGQVTIHSNTCAAATAGWTYTNGDAAQPIQQGTYWLIEQAGDIIISETFDVSGYTNLTLTFDVGTYGSGTNYPCLVEYSTDNGATWNATIFTSATPTSSTLISAGTWNIGTVISTQFKLRWTKVSGLKGVRIDNILFQGVVPAGSALVVSPTTLTGFSYFVGSGPSTSQSYNLSGTLLTGFPSNITVTAPTNYEVSLDNTSFSGSVLVPYTTATLASTPIYARLKAGRVVGAYNGEIITNAGGGATTQNVTCSGDVIASSTSDIISAGGTAASISSTVNTNSPLTSATGVQVWQITVRDGGALPDADNLPTILTAFNIAQVSNTVSNWSQAIKTIELFDGATNVGIATVTATQIQFTGLNISVADNSTKTLSLRMSLNCGIGASNFDLDRFGFSISIGNVTFSPAGSGKSSFLAAQAGGAGINVINVVATKLLFTQQPTTTAQGQNMAPSVTVAATDACNNVDVDFTGTISITSTGSMIGSPQTATAVAGVATFNTINHSASGTGFTLNASTGGLTGTTSTTFDITTVTIFSPGDMAILGFNVNINDGPGTDEVSFVTFVDFTPGTTLDMTDNAYEKCGTTDGWGIAEGWIRLQRTTSTLPAGKVVTIRVTNGVGTVISPNDGNWIVTAPQPSGQGQFNLNSVGEQIFFLQGGVVGGPGASTATSDAGTYSPLNILFGFNTKGNIWTPICANSAGGGTQNSAKPRFLDCFMVWPSSTADFNKYKGPISVASVRTWIERITNSSNWQTYADNTDYVANVGGGYDYVNTNGAFLGMDLPISSAGYAAGQWVGSTDSDWFECSNWQNLRVPDSLVNVTIDNVANDPIIGASPVLYPNGAICNDLLITNTSGSGVLTLNNALSYFSIKGNITNNGIITGTNGLTELRSTNAQSFSGSGSTQFYNLRLNNSNASGVSLLQDVTVSNNLTFTTGMLSTGTNKLIITNTTAPTIFGYSNTKFINGNLRHHIANNTSTYVFPIGDGMATTNYKRFDLINNSLATTTYIDAKVANVPQGTPAADVDANLGASAVQWGTQLTNVLNSAVWTLTPDAQPTSGTYGVNLYVQNVAGLSAADDNMFCPVKRDASSVTYADWSTFLAAPTVIPATGLAGRIYSGGAGYAQRTGYQSFSLHAIAKAPTILPIKLLYFKATANGSVVDLDWATTTEINNDFFTIERSVDAINFEPIYFKNGAGNSYVNLYYSTIDKSPLNGVSYYRLKQTDFDGKYSYSNIETVNFKSSKGLELVNTYHSLESNVLTVKLNCGDNDAIHFELYDMTGKLVHQSLETLNGKNQSVMLSTTQISSGIYLLKVFNNAEVITQKVKF